MSDLLEKRMMLIIYSLGVGFFLIRIIAIICGDTEMYDDPNFMDGMKKIQGIMELLIAVSFIWCVIPRWFNKVRNTSVNKLAFHGCFFVGCVILFVMLPEITGEELEFTTMKAIGVVVFITITALFWLAAYWYGKKYKSEKEGEDGEIQRQVNDEEREGNGSRS